MRLKLLLTFVCVVATALVLVSVIRSLEVVRTTGILQISADSAQANLAISQPNTDAAFIGQGSARVRLKPGTYFLSASEQGSTVTATATITKGQTTIKALDIESQLSAANKYNSLISKLPIDGPAFTYEINYFSKYVNGQSYPVITITAPDQQGDQSALAWIQSQGLNPSNFTIQYQPGSLVSSGYNNYVGGS